MCISPAKGEEGPRGRKKVFGLGFSSYYLSFLKKIVSYFNKYLIMEREGKGQK